MLGKIYQITDNNIYIVLNVDAYSIQNLMNLYVLMQDTTGSYIGEIVDVSQNKATINMLGEYNNGNLVYGFIKRPSFNAKIDLISPNFIQNLIGNYVDENHSLLIGNSPFYEDVKIYANINYLFGSHMALFGVTGSGKSCGFASIIQKLISKFNLSENMNIIIFDAYGEYHDAFNIETNNKYAFKAYTSGVHEQDEKICIPPWLLDVDDYAILLEATNPHQLTIIEKALRNVNLFKNPNGEVTKFKNSIIASALLDILLSGRPAPQIRDQIISALSKFNTDILNLESIIAQPGYNRTLRQCLLIDDNNKINAIELIAAFFQSFIVDEMISSMPDGSYEYSLRDFADALEFALISEGIWKSEKIFDEANILKVRIEALLNSENSALFNYQGLISTEDYIKRLFTDKFGKKAQIVNISIDSLDDRFAKTIVKIFSKLLFNYAKSLTNRASNPFNIILEEAHRYVQNDSDVEILGYNIFERISKEGRKYGVLLGLISQRPNELSSTCLSQCNNFLLFRMTHPVDVDYLSKAIPNITSQIINEMKTVPPGHAIVFGNAFKMPTLVKLELPNPVPNSSNTQIDNIWFE